MKKNGIQFELWKNCENHCDFCFNRGLPVSTLDDKLRILKEVKYRIVRLDYKYYEKIGFIGGELFGKNLEPENVFIEFYRLIELCIYLLQDKKIQQINLTSNLLNENDEKLFKILDLIQTSGLSNRFQLCTSYDSKYRFKTKEKFEIWDNNMKKICHDYPELKLHIETIPTQDFIEKCLNGEIDIPQIKNTYPGVYIDYGDLNSGFYYKDKFDMEKNVPGFFPKRKDFLKWVRVGLEKKWFEIDDICNYDMFFNELYMLDKTNHFIQYIREGHDPQMLYGQIDKSDYIDSDKCMYDDLQDIKNRRG